VPIYENSKLKKKERKKERKERKIVGTIIHACLAGQASVTQVNSMICFLKLEPRDRTMTQSTVVKHRKCSTNVPVQWI
jgi:hypothetical protein